MAPCEWWKCGTVGPGGLLVDTRLSFGSRVAPNKFQRLMMVALREVMRRIHAFDEAHPPTAPGLRAWLTERRAAVGDGRMAAAVQYIDDTCAVSVHDLVEATGRRRGHHHAEIFDEVMVEAGVEMAEGKKREESEVEMEALGVVVSVAEECVYYPEGKRLRVERIIDAGGGGGGADGGAAAGGVADGEAQVGGARGTDAGAAPGVGLRDGESKGAAGARAAERAVRGRHDGRAWGARVTPAHPAST